MKSILGFFLFVIFNLKIATGSTSPSLRISSSGPPIIGFNLTFTAILSDYSTILPDKLYFVFDDGIRQEEHEASGFNCSISRAFSEKQYEEGFYSMNATVIAKLIWEKTVASNYTRFHLTRYLDGEILIKRPNGEYSSDVDEVAIGENITFSVKLLNPENFLKDAIFSYAWSIEWERYPTIDNSLIYNFSEPGMKIIKAMVNAILPNDRYLIGTFEKVVNAKVPVRDLNITGNFFMHHGETLNLNITCNGTPPFIYCYKIMRGNNTSENFTCSHLASFTTCHMEILKYFQEDGRYQVGIYVSNNVREIRRVMEVMVYSVSVSPTLSTVIIPIICSLLAFTIIAGGIAYFVQHKNQLAVEVANFDFQDESDSLTEERTFFEKILDSFTCRNCSTPRVPCASSEENDPLI